MPKSPIFMVLAGLLVASTASAAALAQGGARAFERMDRNGDGVVEAAEVQELRAEMFGKLDADGDGFVTQAEAEDAKARFRERISGKRQSFFERSDADGDGRVSQEEFLQIGRAHV